jgi:hypothetical protein
LGVRPDASEEEIHAAYRRLARRHHPDAAGGRASPDMAAINEAWRALSDPARRVAYDATLRSPSAVGSGPAAELDDDGSFEPGHPHPVGRFGIPLPWILVLGVLGVIFVFTAYAASSHRTGGKPDGLLDLGSCVSVVSAGYVVEASCSGPNDGTVVALPPSESDCPPRTERLHDRPSSQLVCVKIG